MPADGEKRGRFSAHISCKIATLFSTHTVGVLVDGLPDEGGELVGVLADAGHPNRPVPVVVEVGELVRQPLDLLGRKAAVVLDDVVAGGVDRALAHRLAHEEEVVPLRQGDHVVDDRSGRRVLRARHGEEAGVDPLGDHDEVELGADAEIGEGAANRRHLGLKKINKSDRYWITTRFARPLTVLT